MKYGLKVLNPGTHRLGDGKYVSEPFGCTSNNVEDAVSYASYKNALRAKDKLDDLNAERMAHDIWEMDFLPEYEIIGIRSEEVDISLKRGEYYITN